MRIKVCFFYLVSTLFSIFSINAYGQIIQNLSTEPQLVISKDVNNDFVEDLILGFPDNITVYYLHQTENPADIIDTMSSINNIHPKAIATKDLDGNGYLDIIVQDITNKKIYFFLNNGDSFSLQHQEDNIPFANSIWVGNLNNDPYIDLVLGTVNGIVIFWGISPNYYELNNGSWFLNRLTNVFGGNIVSLEVKDIDNNGMLDIIGTTKDGRLIFLSQQEDKNFVPRTFYIGCVPEKLQIQDVNGDGLFELLISCANLNRLKLFYGSQFLNSTFVYPTNIITDSLVKDFALADFDNNGLLDLIIGKNGSIFTYWINQGQQNFVKSLYVSIDVPFDTIISFDYNSNGKTDVLYVSKENKNIGIVSDISSRVIENMPEQQMPELPHISLTISPSGSIEVNGESSIQLKITMEPNDYQGTSGNLKLTISNFNTQQSQYITSTGLTASEEYFWENFTLSQIPEENIFSISSFDLFNKMGTGHYSITATLNFRDEVGIDHYISDTENFSLVSKPIDYNNPPILDLYTNKTNDYLRAYVDFSVPDTWEGLPADIYLWNQCKYIVSDECCVYTQKYTSQGIWDMGVQCQDVSQGCPLGVIDAFTSWSIINISHADLFYFPLSVYPAGINCTVNVKLIIHNWDGIDYTIWKQKTF